MQNNCIKNLLNFKEVIHSTESHENKKKLFSKWVKRNLESPVSQLVDCVKTFQHWAYEIMLLD